MAVYLLINDSDHEGASNMDVTVTGGKKWLLICWCSRASWGSDFCSFTRQAVKLSKVFLLDANPLSLNTSASTLRTTGNTSCIILSISLPALLLAAANLSLLSPSSSRFIISIRIDCISSAEHSTISMFTISQ